MKAPIRSPKIVGDVEFDTNASGFGADEATVSITRAEAKLCVRHWLSMLWVVDTTFDCGTSGSWECAMLNYANYRIKHLEDANLITREEIDAIADEWDWPPFGEEEETCNGDEFGDMEEVEW